MTEPVEPPPNSVCKDSLHTAPVEPPREMVERALKWLEQQHWCGDPLEMDVQSLTAEFTALRSQTLEEAAQKIKDEAETIMRDYVMAGPAGIVKGCIAAIRGLMGRCGT